MKRILPVLLLLSTTSGCYTMLRHPEGDRLAGDEYGSASYALGPLQDCAACHEPWGTSEYDLWPRPIYPTLWVAYNTGPWWQRTGTPQAQSSALANTRPAPMLAPPPPVGIAGLAPGVAPVVKPPAPGHASEPASQPRADSGRRGVDADTPRSGAGRDAHGAAEPHATPPARDANPAPAPSPAAATAQGSGLTNPRPRPS